VIVVRVVVVFVVVSFNERRALGGEDFSCSGKVHSDRFSFDYDEKKL